MISVSGLSKKFGDKYVLKDISFSLPSKGLVLIQGDSGCGKTTLFNCLSSLLTYKGCINIDGINLESLSEKQKDNYRNKNFGFIFQDFKLFNNDSVEANVCFPLDISSNISKNLRMQKCKDLLTLVNLIDKRKRIVNTLSGGEKQRTAIARALINDPKILLADEPTGALDNKNAENIMDILFKISKNTLVIVVSHDTSLAKRYADITITMKDGEIVEQTHSDFINEKDDIRIICNPYKNKRNRIPFNFLFRHSLFSLKQKKWRTSLCIFLISLGLIGIGLSLTLSSSISSNIKEAYSQVVDETKIIVSLKNSGNVQPIMEGAELESAIDVANKYNEYIYDVGEIYLTNFEKHFVDDNSFFAIYGNKKIQLPGFTAININDFGWLDLNDQTVYPYKPKSLNNDEVILGINLNIIQLLCKELGIIRNIDYLSAFLRNNEVRMVFNGLNKSWAYSDQQNFVIKGFVLSIEPMIYHYNHQWNEYVFETSMRFPSTTSVSNALDKPWTLRKLYYFQLKDKGDNFFKKVRSSKLLDDYILEIPKPNIFPLTIPEDEKVSSINKVLFLINNGVSIPYYRINEIIESHPYLSNPLIGTSGGYAIFPEALMMGFSNYAYLSYDEELLDRNLNVYSTLSVEENDAIQNSDGMCIGHYSRNTQKGFIFENIDVKTDYFSFNNIDEIVISSSLNKQLNIDNKNHSTLYFSYQISERFFNDDQVIRDYVTVPLKIIGIVEDDNNVIYQDKDWLISFFQERIGVSAYSLLIDNLSFDVNDRIMDEAKEELEMDYPLYKISNPMGDIDSNIKQMCGYIEIAMMTFSLIATFISIVLLTTTNFLHFLENKKDIGLSRCVGASRYESSKFLIFYSMLISLLAFVLSCFELIVISYFVSFSIGESLSASTTFSLNPLSFIAMFALAFSISFLSSVVIALKYINISPLEAIKN